MAQVREPRNGNGALSMSNVQNPTTLDPNRATWTTEEIGMILSARDQIGADRACSVYYCEPSSFTNPCPCLDAAIPRVAADLEEDESNER